MISVVAWVDDEVRAIQILRKEFPASSGSKKEVDRSGAEAILKSFTDAGCPFPHPLQPVAFEGAILRCGDFHRQREPSVFQYYLGSSLLLCVILVGSRTFFVGDKGFVVKALNALKIPTDSLRTALHEEELREIRRRARRPRYRSHKKK